MRDQNRIRPFCEELAEMWERKPDLRFGQMVSRLPMYADSQGGDLFYLEDGEMLEVMRRFFAGKHNPARVRNAGKARELETRWQALMEKLVDDEFDTGSFKTLFADTWQYFVDATVAVGGICPQDLPMISCISGFSWHERYPRHTKTWDFDACVQVAKALLLGLSDPRNGWYRGNFYGGYLTVVEYHGAAKEIHIREFDGYFDNLAAIYRKNYGEGLE